jgi:hypothetical protein
MYLLPLYRGLSPFWKEVKSGALLRSLFSQTASTDVISILVLVAHFVRRSDVRTRICRDNWRIAQTEIQVETKPSTNSSA